MRCLNAKRGFTLLEISIVLLILSALTVIIYPVAQKRLMISEIDNAVREAQMVADYAESLRTRWLASTDIDPVTGIYSHSYFYADGVLDEGTAHNFGWLKVDELPFHADDLPRTSTWGGGNVFQFGIHSKYAQVSSSSSYMPKADCLEYLEQLQNYSSIEIGSDCTTMVGDNTWCSFYIAGRPSPSQIISQVGKAQFDKAFWYQEEIR